MQVANTPFTFGNAPAPYNLQNTVLSLNVSETGIGSIQTGVLETFAASNVDGGLGSRFASASSLVDDLNVFLVPLLVGSAVTISADTVGSNSVANGDFGSLTAIGDMTFENLVISVFGVNLSIPVAPDPNTVLYDMDGIKIVLNQQFSSVSDSDAFITTNAIVVELNDVEGILGLVSGNVIIAHSAGSLSAVPEPSSMLLLMGGVAAVLLRRRRIA